MLCEKNGKKGHKTIPVKWLKMFWLAQKIIRWQKMRWEWVNTVLGITHTTFKALYKKNYKRDTVEL